MIIMGAKQGAAFKKFAERIFPAMHMSVSMPSRRKSHRLTNFSVLD